MKVTRYNYPYQFTDQLPELVNDIEAMLRDGQYVLSKHVSDFENLFAEYLETSHVSGVNSGTDALVIALRALGIGPGDEVITQANTFHATVAAICLVGATPVLVDVDPDSYLIDGSQLERAFTSATRAIIPVHLYGKPSPMDVVMSFAEVHDLRVIEDAAQAHGARIDGRRVGTFGDFGCFSFHPSKNLAAAGDGGAICTNDESLLEKVNVLRGLGQQSQNHHIAVGYNSKLDAIQARVLSAKLPHLDQWNAMRREVAQRYRDGLSALPLQFQSDNVREEHVYHLFQIRTRHRDQLVEHLRSSGVDAVVRYPTPIHLQPAFGAMGWKPGDFPVAESLANELLCLPIRPSLSDEEISYTVEQVRSFFAGLKCKQPASQSAAHSDC